MDVYVLYVLYYVCMYVYVCMYMEREALAANPPVARPGGRDEVVMYMYYMYKYMYVCICICMYD